MVIYTPQSCRSAFAIVNQNLVVVAVIGQSRKVEHQPCIGICGTEHLTCILQVGILGISFVYHIACATGDIGRRGYHFGANRRNTCAPRTVICRIATEQNRKRIGRCVQHSILITMEPSHTRTRSKVAIIYFHIVVASIIWQRKKVDKHTRIRVGTAVCRCIIIAGSVCAANFLGFATSQRHTWVLSKAGVWLQGCRPSTVI